VNNTPEFERYPFNVEPLPKDEGGGFVIRFPDLPGCMSDGATYAEAIANGREAFKAWMEAQVEDGRPVPQPHGAGEPAKFVQRLPKYLHSRLMERAAQEGVSMNSLVTTFVAEGLAGREPYRHAPGRAAGVQDKRRRRGT
jgi:antitoxin HicB